MMKMNRFLCVLMTCSLIGVASIASGAILFEENFETVSSGWNVGSSSGGSISFADAGSGAAFPTRSLRLAHLPNNATQLISSMAVGGFNIPRSSTESYTFEFDLRFSSIGGTALIIFSDSAFTNQYPMMIQVNPGGTVTASYWNGSANTVVTLVNMIAAETTYSFTLTSTPADGTYSAVVSNGTNELVSQEFRHIQSNGADRFTKLDSLVFYNNGGSAVDFNMYVDNIRVTSIPEPGVMALFGLSFSFLLVARRFRHQGLWALALTSVFLPSLHASETVESLSAGDFLILWKADDGLPSQGAWGRNGIGEPRMFEEGLRFDTDGQLGDCFLRHKLREGTGATGTVQFRMKVDAQSHDAAAAAGVSIHLQGKTYTLSVQADGVQLNKAQPIVLNTRIFTTYRLVIGENGALLFLNNEEIPRGEVQGMDDEGGRAALSFGVLGKRSGGRTEWEYIGFSPVLEQSKGL